MAHLRRLFQFEGLQHHRWNLSELANEVELKDAINKYFTGDIINETEDRAVLHTALRSPDNSPILVDGSNIVPELRATQEKMYAFCDKVISGDWKGYTGKSITHVVNIGIGGSCFSIQVML